MLFPVTLTRRVNPTFSMSSKSFNLSGPINSGDEMGYAPLFWDEVFKNVLYIDIASENQIICRAGGNYLFTEIENS